MLLGALVLAGTACKSEEDKARETAQKQFAEAAAQMAEASKTLAKHTAAQGVEGAAQGVQGAAQGVQGAAEAMQKFAQAMKGMQGGKDATGKPVEPVDFRELRALLPEQAAGINRKSAKGEKVGMAGMNLSQASGRYDDGDRRIDIKLVDTGGVLGPMMLASLGLAMVEIDREDDNGYERTSTVNGNKVFEKWKNQSKHGEYKIVVSARFVVEVDGRGLTMDELKAIATGIDLGKLATLGAAK